MDDKKLEELMEGVASAAYLHGNGESQSFTISEAKSRLRAFIYANSISNKTKMRTKSAWPQIRGLKVLQESGIHRFELSEAIQRLSELECDRHILEWLLKNGWSGSGETARMGNEPHLLEVELTREGIWEAMNHHYE